MKRFFGGLLLAVGILLMTVSGLCSIIWLVSMIGNAGSDGTGSLIGLTLLVGGTPFALGLGLLIAGRNLLRRPPAPDAEDIADRFR